MNLPQDSSARPIGSAPVSPTDTAANAGPDSAQTSPGRRLAPLALLFATQFLIALGAAMALKLQFGFSKRMVLGHLALALALLIAQFWAMALLAAMSRRWTGRLATWLLVAVPCTLNLAMGTLYLADWKANINWGANFSLSLLADALLRAPAFVASSPSVLLWPALLGALIVAMHLPFGAAWRVGLQAITLGNPAGAKAGAARAPKARLAGLGAATAVYLTVLALVLPTQVREARLHGEPLTELFWPTVRFTLTPYRYEILRRDGIARTSYPASTPTRPRDIVLITIDDLRSDHLPAYGYERQTTPFLQSEADAGRLHRVDYAMSTCSETVCGLLSILASRRYKDLVNGNFTLQEVLQSSGYRTHFILSSNHSNWYELRDCYGTALDYYFDGSMSMQYPPTDDRTTLEGLEGAPPPDGRPGFFWFYLLAPHMAGPRLPEYHRFPSELNGLGLVDTTTNSYPQEALINFYDNGIVQADDTIRQILEQLRTSGQVVDPLVVITADHGESLGEDGRFGHGRFLSHEQTSIPLLFLDGGDTPYGDLSFATLTDIAPTLVDAVGLPIPSVWQGQSLLSAEAKTWSLHQATWESIYAVVHRVDGHIYKLVCDGREKGAPERWTLYDLATDPTEQHDLIDSVDPALLKEMRQRVADYRSN